MSKKIVVFGNTVFTSAVLETLYKSKKYELSAWTNDTRDNPVVKSSLENSIPVHQFDKAKFKSEGLEVFKKINPDLALVVAYGRIIPQSFLDIPKFGFINIHGSLLPDLRGATPIQTAILKGYENTGVTIQQMVAKMDEGDLLRFYETEIDDQDNFESLRQKMIEKVSEDLILFLEDYFSDAIKPIKQNDSKATYCWIKDFTREAGKIDWNASSHDIHNKIRAFYPEPVAWSLFQGKVLNFISSNVSENNSFDEPGTMFVSNKKLYVATTDKDLEITKLVMEGKRSMTGTDFANGIVRKDNILLT